MKMSKLLINFQIVILVILLLGCVSEEQTELDPFITNDHVIEPSDTPSTTPENPTPEVKVNYFGWIAFLVNNEGTNNITLVAPNFAETKKIDLINTNPQAISWSPNYDYLAIINFKNTDTGIYLINLECLELKQDCARFVEKIIGGVEAYWGDLEWSPDGKYLITSSLDYSSNGKPTLKIIGIDTKTILDFPEIVGWDPSWSPDGSSILFTGPLQCEQGCQGEINILDMETYEITVFSIPMLLDAYEGKWSPDGEQIIFTSSDFYSCDGYWCFNENLYIIDSDGTNLQLLARGGYKSSWSPDGLKIVFQRDDGLYSVSPDGSNLIQIFAADEMGYQMDPSWNH